MPIPASEPTVALVLTWAEWAWMGATILCLMLALYVVLEFIKIVRREV